MTVTVTDTFSHVVLYVCLRMVSPRVKVCVSPIVFLSNGISRSQSRVRLRHSADHTLSGIADVSQRASARDFSCGLS